MIPPQKLYKCICWMEWPASEIALFCSAWCPCHQKNPGLFVILPRYFMGWLSRLAQGFLCLPLTSCVCRSTQTESSSPIMPMQLSWISSPEESANLGLVAACWWMIIEPTDKIISSLRWSLYRATRWSLTYHRIFSGCSGHCQLFLCIGSIISKIHLSWK